MSLILEALKKSEAERQLGRAPGLMDVQPLARRRRPTRLWPVLLALLLLVIGAGAYWFGLHDRGAGDAAPPLATSDIAASRQDRLDAGESVALPPLPSDTAVPPTAPSGNDDREAPSSRLPSDPGFASVEREARPQLPAELPAEPSSAMGARPQPPPSAAASEPQQTPPQMAAPAQPTPVAPIIAAPPVPPPEVALPSPTPAPAQVVGTMESLPDLASLGHEARGQLPPLKLSMHVYTEDPSGRVVIIDGRRLSEGDLIDGRLRLVEIRRDGSVLELDGRRYRLPRP